MRQECGQLGNRMVGNPGQNVLQPIERIDFVPLAGCYETPQHRSGVAAVVAAEEGPVVAVMYTCT